MCCQERKWWCNRCRYFLLKCKHAMSYIANLQVVSCTKFITLNLLFTPTSQKSTVMAENETFCSWAAGEYWRGKESTHKHTHTHRNDLVYESINHNTVLVINNNCPLKYNWPANKAVLWSWPAVKSQNLNCETWLQEADNKDQLLRTKQNNRLDRKGRGHTVCVSFSLSGNQWSAISI